MKKINISKQIVRKIDDIERERDWSWIQYSWIKMKERRWRIFSPFYTVLTALCLPEQSYRITERTRQEAKKQIIYKKLSYFLILYIFWWEHWRCVRVWVPIISRWSTTEPVVSCWKIGEQMNFEGLMGGWSEIKGEMSSEKGEKMSEWGEKRWKN